MKLTRGRNEIITLHDFTDTKLHKVKHHIVIGSSQREGGDSKTLAASNLTN